MNMKPELTPEQRAVVEHSGGPLLVSAAAGSGKTKVLVERLLRKIEAGDSITDFLIITYTRAAAAELRERIIKEILIRLSENPGNRSLRRQAMLCKSANIDTIHSFCTAILRENAHKLKLPADFRVLDENESEMIKLEVLETLLDEEYEAIDSNKALHDLVETMASGRNDSKLVKMISKTYDKLRSMPNPRLWMDQQLELMWLDGSTDVADTIWGRHLMTYMRKVADSWLGKMRLLREEMRAYPDFEKAYGESIETTITGIHALYDATYKSWDEVRANAMIEFPKPKGIKGYEDFKAIRQKCKDSIVKAAKLFECSSKDHIEDIIDTAPAIEEMFRLLSEYDSAYSKEKARQGVVDFSDLEHLTLSMLIEPSSGENTAFAKSLSQRFKEIMVDEYQDVNAVQELLFKAFSKEGANIFMVGDVKQSIYSFRLADPSIFLGKKELYRGYEKAESKKGLEELNRGKVIHLSNNFRSQAEILISVNRLFSVIMSKEFGEMDYNESEYLIAGRADQDENKTDQAVELCLVDMSSVTVSENEDDENLNSDSKNSDDDDKESPEKIFEEARYIAQRIKQLVDSDYMIPDGKGGKRSLSYKDVVILLRSMKGKAWQYGRALGELGIPYDLPGNENFFETLEVSAVLSYISVIDNPLSDVEVAAVLRGPIYGLSLDELAEIRLTSKKTDYYSAVEAAAKTNQKCARFLNDIAELRIIAQDMPADKFIRKLYIKTSLPEKMALLPQGLRRKENLLLLADKAELLEQGGYKGIFSFIAYVRYLQENDFAIKADIGFGAANAVSLMSVHKSKGLEFPVVFLADMSKKFNMNDVNSGFVMHQHFGVAAKKTDRARKIEYDTLPKKAIKEKLTDELKAEELRVLYVAMTRAREKLIMVSALNDAKKELDKISQLVLNEVSPVVLSKAKNALEWILMSGTLNAKSGSVEELLQLAGERAKRAQDIAEIMQKTPETGHLYSFENELNREVEIKTDAIVKENKVEPFADCSVYSSDSFSEYPEIIKAYSYLQATTLPSKLTVTELKGKSSDIEDAESADFEYFVSAKRPSRSFCADRPSFIVERTDLTTSEAGTALHVAMQYLDTSKNMSKELIDEQILTFVEGKKLTKKQAESVDSEKIAHFFASKIGERMTRSGNVKREFKFSLLSKAERYYKGGGDDEILLQGVIDCYFEEENELVVIDYKTDRVTDADFADKVNLYRVQLETYSEVLQRVSGKRVKEKVIYFFSANKAVTL